MSTAARKARKRAGEKIQVDDLTPDEIVWPNPPALVKRIGAPWYPELEVARGAYADVFYTRPLGKDFPVRKVMIAELQRDYRPCEAPPTPSQALERAVDDLAYDFARAAAGE